MSFWSRSLSLAYMINTIVDQDIKVTNNTSSEFEENLWENPK